MSRGVGIINLASSAPFDFVNLTNHTAAFTDDRFIVNVENTQVGNFFFSSTVTGLKPASSDAYIRAELWHSYGGANWYLLSTTPAQQNDHNSFFVKEFGPYIRLKIAVATTNSTYGNSITRDTATATFRAVFTYRDEI